MKIKIHSVVGKGDLEKESVWLQVLEKDDIGMYLLSDTTYRDNGKISNELRHIYWFPDQNVEKGDWIHLFTKNGKNTSSKNEYNTTTYSYYWNLGRTIWNKGGDAAVLFRIGDWEYKSV
jgi:hypothetical protein